MDDDPGVLKGLRGLLSDEGFSPVEARSAAEAVRLLDSPGQPPALMLLDLRMPGETGLELLARLPRPLPIPVVVLSGEASPSEALQALKLGATDFVEKPPSPERLLTALRNALALSELREEQQRLQEELARPGHLVGDSPAMESLRKLIARVGPSRPSCCACWRRRRWSAWAAACPSPSTCASWPPRTASSHARCGRAASGRTCTSASLTLTPESLTGPSSLMAARPSRLVLGHESYREHVDDFERTLIQAALEEGGSIAGAARLLQVDRGNLYRRVKALGLPVT